MLTGPSISHVSAVVPVPQFQSFSPNMRVDALLSDWKAALSPEKSAEEKERLLYDQAWAEYIAGDYGFGLWCWHECDRLNNATGSLKEVTRILGHGHYLGYSHRRAIAERVPVERIYRPRKGDMSTPRPEAIVVAFYQLLCVYAVRAAQGDKAANAQLSIALGELEDRRRADPFIRYFETFRDLLARDAGGLQTEAKAHVGSP